MKLAVEIVDQYQKNNRDLSKVCVQVMELASKQPKAIVELIMIAIERKLKHPLLVEIALELIDENGLTNLARAAWDKSRDSPDDEVISTILRYAAVHFPSIFANDWERFLEIDSTNDIDIGYLNRYVWRALDKATANTWLGMINRDGVAFRSTDIARTNPQAHADLDLSQHDLRQILIDKANPDLSRLRVLALLASRQADIVIAVWHQISADPEINRGRDQWLQTGGFAMPNGVLRTLHNETPLHMHFHAPQGNYLLSNTPDWTQVLRQQHPTWGETSKSEATAKFGGTTTACCGLCHGHLHRLLKVDQAREIAIDIDGPIELATCLSCLGWSGYGAMFYRHAENGFAHPHPSQILDQAKASDFPASPLCSCQVNLFHAPTRWAWQDWCVAEIAQNLNRVGGAPSWIQDPEYPECPDCKERMRFVMQLNSGFVTQDGDEWLWGSGGINYSFWCDECRVSAHFWQCT